MTTPLGGAIGWGYGEGATTTKYREVTQRTAIGDTWTFTRDGGVAVHSSATLADAAVGSAKLWTFGGNSLPASYEEQGAGGARLVRSEYTWTSDANGNVYVGSVVTKVKPGAADEVSSKSAQTVDVNGNLTQSQAYDYGNLATPAKTYNFTYLTDGNYTSRHIFNRVTQVTVTPAGGGATTVVTNLYDTQSYGACTVGLVSRTGTFLHDDANYGSGMIYRGNLGVATKLGDTTCYQYETTGVMVKAGDLQGRAVSTTPSSSTGYSLPGVVTPNGNSNLATSMSYASSWAVTSVIAPNGAQATTTYDGLGRPQASTIPDGATTNYSYTYNGVGGATANTQTATVGSGAGARWKKTTLDGFGRTTRVESGHDSVTVSQVDTQYAACACSPLGKLWRVSQPYAPGGTPVWTTYAYDGSGRTVSVTAPDGSVTTTQYLTSYGGYSGNLVKVTDPAGKWKIQQSDALGNLIRVIEPDPAGGSDLVTNYTYSVLGQLIGVSMPRNGVTQTRTFVYTGSDLTSATNPENGTVTYQYDGSHHVTKRTDAKGQETRYGYDTYGRLSEVQHWAGSPLVEVPYSRVNYYYDTNPLNGSYSQNAWGRLTAVTFPTLGHNFQYLYSYSQAGRVTAQQFSDGTQTFDTGYSWDTEGRMTQIAYPGTPGIAPVYQMTFDAMGRVGGMTENGGVASASYGVAGELTALSYYGYAETR
ncbi:MAG: RHS repeat protein, partial [Acidobacteria bacterium]|nr:RHS repeat protein [Acidobacteriota bacterium]